MLERPKISVVIPVHNDSAKIEKCIESLSSKIYPKEKIEVIVIDDGSNDGIENWLPKKFPEVEFFRKGRTVPADSRNRGINRYYELETILKAAPAVLMEFPETQFLFVGDGNNLDHLKALSEQLGVKNSVVFTGFRPRQKSPRS